jgi:molybdopterin molybdotransferase
VSGATVRARRPEPPTNVAAMDGYAVRLPAAEGSRRFKLRPGFLSPSSRPRHLRAGEAIEIGTGARMPAGGQAVVRSELARSDASGVVIRRAVAVGSDVHRTGEDLARGEIIVRPGERIGPYHQAAMIAQRIGEVRVRVPRITVVVTGDEFGGQERDRAAGVSDSISPLIRELAGRTGEVRRLLAPDREGRLGEVIRRAARASDLVVTIGGTSVGARDRTKPAIRAVGALAFEGVRANVLKRGAVGHVGRTPVIVLPGQVVSAVVVWHEFGRPVLARLTGAKPDRPVRSRLAAPLHNPHPMDSVYLFRVSKSGARACRWGVRLYSELVRADAYGIVPRSTRLPRGYRIELRRLEGSVR